MSDFRQKKAKKITSSCLRKRRLKRTSCENLSLKINHTNINLFYFPTSFMLKETVSILHTRSTS